MSPTTRAMLGFAADWPLLKKIQTIDSFLGNDYFYESGIMYAMWRWKGDELRPYCDEDFAGQLPFVRPGMTAAGQMDNENSTYTSGIFLWSQCLRYMVTREPDALEFAAKAFRSIDLVFKLTEATPERGFLCKPYQWQASRESSPDQQYTVMMALWLYRDLCDKQTRERADVILVEIADWWMRNDYKLAFFGSAAGSWLMGNIPQYGPMFALMAHLAYRVTNDEKYLRECRRILELCGPWMLIYDDIRLRRRAGDTSYYPWPKHLHGREYDPGRRPFLMSDWETRAPMWFVAGPAEYFMQTDLVNRHLMRHVLGRIYRYMQFGLRDDLLQLYWEQVDLERDLWRPLSLYYTEETIKNPLFGWHFMGYVSEVCNQDGVFRLVDACLIAHEHAYEFAPGAFSLAKRILATLDADRMRTFVDPDGQQLLPPDQYLKHTICSELPDISIAYWRARLNRIPLE